MQEEIERATKEFKGKKFTLDVDGKPVQISPVVPDRLPPFAYQLGLNITSGPSEPNTKQVKESLPKKKKYKVRVVGSRDIEDSFFVASSSLVTSLSGGNIILNPGVSIRTNDQMREGPPPPEDPRKPSRKTFFANRSVISGSSVLGGPSTLGSVPADSPNSDFRSSDPRSRRSSAASPSDFSDMHSPHPSPNVPVVPLRSTRFAEVDPLEGARKIQPKLQPIIEPSDAELGLGPGVTIGSKAPPPKLPSKPSTKQGEIVEKVFGGHEQPKPRDRDPPRAQVPPTDRKKLPPPPIGLSQRPRVVQSGINQSSVSIASGQSNDLLSKTVENRRLSTSDDRSVNSFSSTGPLKVPGGRIKPETTELFKSLF